MSVSMKNCLIPTAAFWVAAGFVVALIPTRANAEEFRAVALNRAELITRVQSDSWSVRRAALRALRGLAVDDANMLVELAGHDNPQVRSAALDVLSDWSRGRDEAKRAASRDLLSAISKEQHVGAKSASARLDAVHDEIERSVLAELAAFFHPALEMT
jgi:HEAT repeat protein